MSWSADLSLVEPDGLGNGCHWVSLWVMIRMNISEADWKVYKRIRDLAQDRYSQRVLDDAGRLCRDESMPVQDRHAELSRLLRERLRRCSRSSIACGAPRPCSA
jgi:hypothetical protein